MNILIQIFISFFKTSVCTFGGGYAALPVLKNEISGRRKWVTEDELLNYYSMSECVPGIIAVNVAVFCGYKLKKTAGAVTALAASVLPSVIIMLLAATVLDKVLESPAAEHIFGGIRIGVTALLVKVTFDTAVKIYKDNSRKYVPVLIFTAAAATLMFLHLSAVVVVLCALALGLAGLIYWRCKK